MKWDADPEVQHWYYWPLTPPWNDPETYEARRANAERVVWAQPAAWEAGEGVLRSHGAFAKYEPLLGQRFDWAIYGRLRTE